MPVAPEIALLLPALSALPQMHQTPLAQLRMPRERVGAIAFQPVGDVVDRTIPTPGGVLPVRLYAPAGKFANVPLVIMFHGGGFVFGGLDGTYDHICRVLCAQLGCRVMSVDYRLAPENKFPTGADDAFAALQWAVAESAGLGIDTAKIFLAGGSAGANLGAVTALRARDAGGPAVCGQILYYPVTDQPEPPTPSMLKWSEGYYLTRADVVWFWEQYLADPADAANAYAAPLRAPILEGLPPALILTAEYDPLCDEGEHYARRLADEGVAVKLSRYDGMIHGFLGFQTPTAVTALHDTVAWIKSVAGP